MRLLALAIAVMLLWAAPADARLGDHVAAVKRSRLVQGDSMFTFEARVGDRYRFTGARHCMFGTGLLCLDTWNGRVVQQVLVMPLPANAREERTLRWVAGLFLEEAGLEAEWRKAAMAAFEHTYKTAHGEKKPLGKRYELHTYCDPNRNGVMLVVGLKP